MNEAYPAAIAAFREVVEIDRSISPESDDVSIDLNTLANAEMANGDYEAAESDYHEALRIAKIMKNDESIAIYTGNLAGLAVNLEQWGEAESLAREALALAEEVGRKELIASNCRRIAKVLLKQNKNLDEALSLSRCAVEIYTYLKSPDLQSAQKTMAEIEKTLGER